MEDFYNLEERNNDITSEDSSDESSYYSACSTPDLLPYEEVHNYNYSYENNYSSVYSGSYEPVTGDTISTASLPPANWIEVLGIFPVEVRGTTFYHPLFYYVPAHSDTDFSSSTSDMYSTAEECESYFDSEAYDYEAEEFSYLNETDTDFSSSDSYFTAEGSESYFEPEECDDGAEEFNTDFSSSDSYCTLEDSESDYDTKECDYGAEEFGYLNETTTVFSSTDSYCSAEESYFDPQERDHGAEEIGYWDFLSSTSFYNCTPKESKSSNNPEECDYVAEEFDNLNETDKYKHNKKSLSPDPDSFELTEEEVKYRKDRLYFRVLTGKLSVDVLPTILEEDENLCESDEEPMELQTSCLIEQQALLTDSSGLLEPTAVNEEASDASNQVDVIPTNYEESERFCESDEESVDPPTSSSTEQQQFLNDSPGVSEPSSENEEASETSKQKPKKKKKKRLRKFFSRIFCCVKPP